MISKKKETKFILSLHVQIAKLTKNLQSTFSDSTSIFYLLHLVFSCSLFRHNLFLVCQCPRRFHLLPSSPFHFHSQQTREILRFLLNHSIEVSLKTTRKPSEILLTRPGWHAIMINCHEVRKICVEKLFLSGVSISCLRQKSVLLSPSHWRRKEEKKCHSKLSYIFDLTRVILFGCYVFSAKKMTESY